MAQVEMLAVCPVWVACPAVDQVDFLERVDSLELADLMPVTMMTAQRWRKLINCSDLKTCVMPYFSECFRVRSKMIDSNLHVGHQGFFWDGAVVMSQMRHDKKADACIPVPLGSFLR